MRHSTTRLFGICTFALTGAALTCHGIQAQTAASPENSTAVAAVAAVDPGGSSVRIVRLSEVRGEVQMDRNTGRGFEAAFANIPVVAGSRLRTGQGVAEVEFEDNSSLRLAPGTEILFQQLSRTGTGATETAVQLSKGLAYVGLTKTRGNTFSVADGSARVVLSPGAHVRLDATGPDTQLAVFEGSAQLMMGSTSTVLSKRESIELNPVTQTVATVAKGNDEGVWDGWDKQENDYHKQKASFAGNGFGAYGANDLNYYGSFADLPGCGQVWRPYFATAAWDPFANGAWAYYPSAGYSWVSPYPWGWLPYHSGSWASCGAAGWGWRPSGSWYGLNNQPVLRLANHPLPHPVPIAPGRSGATVVHVNTRPLPVSGLTGAETFTFRRDSAGLGVPRVALGSLHGASLTMERHGLATRGVMAPAYVGVTQASAAGSPSRAASGGAAMPYPGVQRSGIGAAGHAAPAGRTGMAPLQPGTRSVGSSLPSPSMGMPGSGRSLGGSATGGVSSGAKR